MGRIHGIIQGSSCIEEMENSPTHHRRNIMILQNNKPCLSYVMVAWQQQRCSAELQQCINSLAPGRFQFEFRKVIFKLTLVNCGWGISYEIVLRWMPLDLTDDKSTLVQVMAWCHQATSYYLSQCWPRSTSPNGVITPQWVKMIQFQICL